MARFVIYGATGYTGKRVVRDLIARGDAVAGVTRSQEGAAVLRELGAEPWIGDPNDRESIRGSARGADYVIHCTSGMLQPGPEDGERPYASQIRSILDEAAAAGVKKYIWTGTCSVYGDQPGKVITEDFPIAPVNPMGFVTAEMENLVWQVAREKQVPAVVLRVPGITVPERAQAWQGVKDGTFTIPGDGSPIIPLIHVEDLATACILAADRGVPGEAYNVGLERFVSFGEWWDLVADRFGVDRPKRVPLDQLPPAARAWAPIDMNISTEKARRDLGLELKYPTVQDLVATLN
jgi:nucleoside-diphosphate-sugar epimerase